MSNRIVVIATTSIFDCIDRDAVLEFIFNNFRDNCGRVTFPVIGEYSHNGMRVIIKDILDITPNNKYRENNFIVCEGSSSLTAIQNGIFVFPAGDESRFLQIVRGGGASHSGEPLRLSMKKFNNWLTKPIMIRPCDVKDANIVHRLFYDLFVPETMEIVDSTGEKVL